MTEVSAKKTSSEKKSGIKKFQAGEVIFHENDPAESLYIIQRGQIRLYRPKGRGFVEIAILRSGEVIGEMAYFDEKASRRSCSAAALVGTEVIEISFKAFDKTMGGLNPWFKTIINTLADRLRKTNDQLKRIESNSLSYGKDGGASDYEFFHASDIVRLIGCLYLSLTSHGEIVEGGQEVSSSIFKFYAHDIFGLSEAKVEEFKILMSSEGFLDLVSADENSESIKIRDTSFLRSMMIFLNTQRLADSSKQIKISKKCQMLMGAIIASVAGQAIKDDWVDIKFNDIFSRFEKQGHIIGKEEYSEILEQQMGKDLLVESDGTITGKVDIAKIKKIYPSIKMMNAVAVVNEAKKS